MRAVKPEVAALEQNGITAVALPRINDPSVIPLWFGEGDQPTDAFIREAAKTALDQGRTFYDHTRGLVDLRLGIREYLERLYSITLSDDRVSVPGSSMLCVTIAAQMALGRGDEAVIVSPHWPNIETSCRVAGADVTIVRQRLTNQGWQLGADEIIKACSDRTRCIYVNSPCNPTGWVMPRQEQQKLLDYCCEQDILLIADEVYHRHYYSSSDPGTAAPSFLELAGEEDPVVVINGFSKAWAMTGWRVGWVIAPASQALRWTVMSECFNTGATVFAQDACIEAIRRGEEVVTRLRAQYEQGRALVMAALGDHPAIELAEPQGAFYAFPRIRGLTSSREFAERLLAEMDVGVAPGYTFGPGNEDFIRLCFAISHDRLAEGLERFVAFVDRHHN